MGGEWDKHAEREMGQGRDRKREMGVEERREQRREGVRPSDRQ